MTNLDSFLLAEGVADPQKRQELGEAIRAARNSNYDPINHRIKTISAVAQEDPRLLHRIDAVKAASARLGFFITDTDKPIDIGEMNKCLAGKDVTDRIALKVELAKLHLIP
jgi:hypothetical protein